MFWNKTHAAQSYDRLKEEFNEIELEGVNTGFKQTRRLDRESALSRDEETVYEEEGEIVEIHKVESSNWTYQESLDQSEEVVKNTNREKRTWL